MNKLGNKIYKSVGKLGNKFQSISTKIGDKTNTMIKKIPDLNNRAIELGNKAKKACVVKQLSYKTTI